MGFSLGVLDAHLPVFESAHLRERSSLGITVMR